MLYITRMTEDYFHSENEILKSLIRLSLNIYQYHFKWLSVLHLRNVYSQGIVNPIYLASLASMFSMDLMDYFSFLKNHFMSNNHTL